MSSTALLDQAFKDNILLMLMFYSGQTDHITWLTLYHLTMEKQK
jgi:hypothetical protein